MWIFLESLGVYIDSKHKKAFLFFVALIFLVLFLIFPIVGESVRFAIGGFSEVVSILVAVFYGVLAMFAAVISTCIVGVAYIVLTSFSPK